MRFAIFSDIHANLQAWEAVLADIQSQGVDTLVCLGDVVGYGPMPGPVLESVYQHTDNFVLGNHDAVVGGRIDAATFNEHARYVIEWTAEQLGEEGAAFFAQVPLTLRGEKMLFTHGDAARPGHFDYVVKAEDARPSFQACKDEVLFFGHTHDPCVFACANNKGIIDKLPGSDVVLKKGRRYMVNPGSVGDPRCASDLRGSYCIFDDATRMLNFRKVEFDTEAYRADLAASGLEMNPYFLRVIDAGSRRPEEEEELALVQDHLEEVEVDEEMTAQPRALVSVGSPMANRPKLHFGYTPQPGYPPPQVYPGAHPPVQPGLPHTRPLYQVPVAPKRNITAIWIVGSLIGLVALIFVLSQMGGPSEVDLATVDTSSKESADLVGDDEGWEDPEPTAPRSAAISVPMDRPSFPPRLTGSAAVFSLSSFEEKPFEKYDIQLPAKVQLVESEMGEGTLKFGSKAAAVQLEAPPELEFGGSISIAVWVKVKPSNRERLIYGRLEGKSKLMTLSITSTKHKYPGCAIFTGKGVKEPIRSSSKKRIDDGKWHLVVVMHNDDEDQLRIYIDGVRSRAMKPKGTYPKITAPVVIGGNRFDGEIYGLRIFDRGLSVSEIDRIYEVRR